MRLLAGSLNGSNHELLVQADLIGKSQLKIERGGEREGAHQESNDRVAKYLVRSTVLNEIEKVINERVRENA